MMRKALGSRVKALVGRRIEGYLVRYTSSGDVDLQGEYFTRATDFNLTANPIVGKPILVEHGVDRHFKAVPIGLFDFASEDEIGIYVRGRLFDVAEYERMLREQADRQRKAVSDETLRRKAAIAVKAVDALLDTGKAHFSSGALPQSVEVAEDGHIDRWMIVEGSITLTPAEPDGTEVDVAWKRAKKSVMANLKEGVKVKVDVMKLRELVNEMLLALSEDETVALEQAELIDAGQVIEEVLMEEMKDDPELEAALLTEPDPEDEEEGKMSDGELDEEEDDEAGVMRRAKAAKERALLRALARVSERREKRRERRKTSTLKMLEAMKDELSKAARLPYGEYPQAKATKDWRVSVEEPERYRYMTAHDMAFGLLVGGKSAFSDDYMRHFLGKTARYVNGVFPSGYRSPEAIKAAVPRAVKANELNASTIATQGLEWVGEFWLSEIWERERYDHLYDNLVGRGMRVIEVPRGASQVTIPTEGNDPVVYASPQAVSTDSHGYPEVVGQISPFKTGNVVIAPGELKAVTSFTDILDEDSAVAILPQTNRQMEETMISARDRLLINGDDATAANTNINLIDGTPATGIVAPYYLASNGFRKLPLVTATGQSVDAVNTMTIALYRRAIAKLPGELRQYQARLVFIIDPDTETASLALPEIATEDVRRTNATITTGKQQNIYGVDVVTSGFLPLTNTAGKVSGTPANNVRGTILLVYAPYWAVAFKREITFETQRFALSDATVVLARMRIGVGARGTNAASLVYNVAV